MNIAVIGAGHIGREIKRLRPEVALLNRTSLWWMRTYEYGYDQYDIIIDTAWKGSTSKALRECEKTQRVAFEEAEARINNAKQAGFKGRYIMLGSKAEGEKDERLATALPKSPYGAAKVKVSRILIETLPNSCWIRLLSVVHPDMPQDTFLPRAARDSVACEDGCWAFMPLPVAARTILRIAESNETGVINLVGNAMLLRKYAELVSGGKRLHDTAGYVASPLRWGRCTQYVELYDETNYIIDLGKYWRADDKVREAQNKRESARTRLESY